MAKDWIGFLKLSGNPFDTIPLQTEDHFNYLFVKIDDVTNQIDPMIKYFEQSPPFLRIIAAPRGSGKSTILHYMASALRSKNGIAVCFVTHQPAVLKGERDPAYGIGNDTVSKIVMGLAERLLDSETGINKSVLKELLDNLGMITSRGILDSKSITTFSYTTNRNRLEKLLEYMKKRGIRGFIAIDNYDKLDEDRAIGFLKSTHSQPLFEDLQSAGVSVAIAASLEWTKRLGEEDLNYLGKPLILNPLNPREAISLVRKRIASKSSGEPKEIFEDPAITRITIREEGIARNILETCRLCATKAAERNTDLISEAFVKEILRSQERTAAKYYRVIKKEPNARMGLIILSSLAKEVDPDTFRQMLQGLVDIFEKRLPSSDVIDQLRRHKILYISKRTIRPELLKNYLASEIQILLRTIGKRYSLNVFMDWLATGEPVFWFIPTMKEHRADSTIEEQFDLLLPAFATEEVKLLFRNAHTSYRAWTSQIEQGDFDITQILSDMWMSVWNLAVCAYYSTRAVDEGVFELPKPSYNVIEDFLLGKEETVRRLPDFATVHQYYVFAEKEVPIEPTLIENLYPRIQSLVESLLELSMIVMPYLRKLGIPLPKFRVKDATQLDNRFAPYLKVDDRYVFTFLGDVPPSEFLMLSWFFRNYVYSIFFGKKGFVSDYDLDLYQVKTILAHKAPDFIQAQLSFLGLPKGMLLRFYNSLEFCSSLFRFAKQRPTFVKIFTKKNTIDLALTVEDDSILGSADFSEKKYGSKIDLSTIPSALSKIKTLKRPPRLFISYSGKDRSFAVKLARDLKRRGVKVWIDLWEIKVGDSIVAKISDAIQGNDYLAVVLTPASVKSNWVQKELAVGLIKELEEKSVAVLPLLAKKCKIPPLIRDKKYANFLINYNRGLRELIERLKS